MYCIFTELFPPSSTWKTVGGVAHTAPQVEEECDYPSSTCSFKSAAQTWIFHGGTIWKRFQTYWHISCLAGYVRSLWDVLAVESPVAPEDGFGCVLECVAPADSGAPSNGAALSTSDTGTAAAFPVITGAWRISHRFEGFCSTSAVYIQR